MRVFGRWCSVTFEWKYCECVRDIVTFELYYYEWGIRESDKGKNHVLSSAGHDKVTRVRDLLLRVRDVTRMRGTLARTPDRWYNVRVGPYLLLFEREFSTRILALPARTRPNVHR